MGRSTRFLRFLGCDYCQEEARMGSMGSTGFLLVDCMVKHLDRRTGS